MASGDVNRVKRRMETSHAELNYWQRFKAFKCAVSPAYDVIYVMGIISSMPHGRDCLSFVSLRMFRKKTLTVGIAKRIARHHPAK